MKRFAIIENGKVINVVMATESFTGGIASDTANIDDLWLGGDAFEAPVAQEADIRYIYAHIELSGGDGRNDPTGVANDGVEGLNVLCMVRLTDDPSSPVVTAMPDKTWRLLLRKAEDNSEYEIISASMTAGVMAFTYKTTNPMAVLVKIDPKDMDEVFEIDGYKYGIRLVGDLQFKVYRRM